MPTNDLYKDKQSRHLGLVVVEKNHVLVVCTHCSIEARGDTENSAKKDFTKRHKPKK